MDGSSLTHSDPFVYSLPSTQRQPPPPLPPYIQCPLHPISSAMPWVITICNSATGCWAWASTQSANPKGGLYVDLQRMQPCTCYLSVSWPSAFTLPSLYVSILLYPWTLFLSVSLSLFHPPHSSDAIVFLPHPPDIRCVTWAPYQ